MSTSGSPRKHPPASPSRGQKRKASEPAAPDAVGPSRVASTSPFHPDYAPSSASSSPGKRLSISSSSRRNSRQARTFRISDDIDEDEDAPYDEELDAEGEDDEFYLNQDAEGEDDETFGLTEEFMPDEEELIPKASSSATPPRQTTRPKRNNAPSVSYYSMQPLPSMSDEEHDEEETPSIRRRAKKTKLPAVSDVDADTDDEDDDPGPVPAKSSRSTRTNTPSAPKHLSGKVPRRPSDQDSIDHKQQRAKDKSEEPELSEEAKQRAKAEKEAEDLQSRWTEEYFEIVEQLPLEVHRTFALMRELEGQMQARVSGMVQNMTIYRDARLAMQKLIEASSGDVKQATSPEKDVNHRGSSGGSEDEAENLLGGSQESPSNGKKPSQDEDVEMISVDDSDDSRLLDKEARRDLLRSISLAANESVKAAEEKMGLAATAYNWIDRHIRRLDADISKLESSILLGLRSGTEESRGAREALGLPVDDGTDEQGADDGTEERKGQGAETISAEAESAALTKAAGAANRASAGGEVTTAGGRRSARTTPKMGGQAKLAAPPEDSENASRRSRSRSASAPHGNSIATASATAAAAAANTSRTPHKATSPAPATRITRKRKPKPLSPQKGGRRSIVTSTPTLISPTTQTPRSGTTTVGPDTSEMPFDPTEPTYCYCDQISFDEMVGCDNEDCTIEWFHYACVGLTGQPKNDEWYCRFCAPPGWKGEGMGVPANAKHKPPGFKKGIGIKP